MGALLFVHLVCEGGSFFFARSFSLDRVFWAREKKRQKYYCEQHKQCIEVFFTLKKLHALKK